MTALPKSQIEMALLAKEPVTALSEIAREMKASGQSQPEIYAAFNALLQTAQTNGVEEQVDAVRDVLDFITGWCSPAAKLFDTYLQV